MSALEIILRRYAIEVVDNRKDFSELEGKGETWKLSPVWSSWASRLDDGSIAFYLPETHEALTFLTGRRVDYIRTRAVGSTTILFLVGYSVGEQTFGPFWSEEFAAKMDQIPSQMSRKLYFARKLQAVLNKCESDRSWRWIKSYREAMQYFSIHRGTVMAVGKLLGINMNYPLSKAVSVAGERDMEDVINYFISSPNGCIQWRVSEMSQNTQKNVTKYTEQTPNLARNMYFSIKL